MDKKRPSTSRNRPYSFPCKTLDLYQRMSKGLSGSSDPHSPDFTRDAYLRDEFLSKFKLAGTAPATLSQRAIDKMVQQDGRNAFTNRRLAKLNTHFGCCSAAQLFSTAQQFISVILGSFTYDVFQGASFSSGATTSRKRESGAAWFKYDGKADVTAQAFPYARALVNLTPLWSANVLEVGLSSGNSPWRIVPGNAVFTVPKSSDIDRAAAKEPDLNMYLQKGIGDHIRARLKLFGINLDDQTTNQKLALEGSITHELATIDLSSASDSVTWKLVEQLLPWKWFDVMSDLRSPRGKLPDGTIIEWEMFSSMGNGFTFELESLLFYALSRAVCYHTRTSGQISVYGDDIIVPVRAAYTLRRVLGWCGFKVNTKKSYWSSPFRESCGKHYYNGLDVTPFYARKPITDVQRLIWFANRLRKWAEVDHMICSPETFSLWKHVANQIPARFHGGKDYESIEALVSPGVPRQKLVSVMTRSDDTDYGAAGVLAWFSGGSVRNEDIDLSSAKLHPVTYRLTRGVPTGQASVMRPKGAHQRFVVKRSAEQYRCIAEYPQELGNVPVVAG